MIATLALLGLAATAPRSAPQEDPWSSFPVFVWRQAYREREIPEELVRVFGGVNVEGTDEATAAREAGLVYYVGHAPGRDELHLERDSRGYGAMWRRFFDERDPSVLVRTPCLTAPETRAQLFERLSASLAARGGEHGVGVSLGDEVSLTPWGDPLDLCYSETCRAAWTAWSRERYGTELPFLATDDVRRAVSDGDPSALGPWLARREFHHAVLLDLVSELARRARADATAPPVGLLGCAGRSAFGGLAIDGVLPQVDFLEAYDVVDARELLYTLRDPARQRALVTIFCTADGADGAAWQAWDHFARGGDGLVVWSDRELEGRPAYRTRLERAVLDIRAARAQLAARGLMHVPRTSGVALVDDWRSTAVGWMRDALLDGATWPRRYQGYQAANGTAEAACVTWLRFLEDLGVMPGAVPLEQVDEHTVARFPVLVLDYLWVVDDEDLERFARYLAAGGHLIVEGTIGWITAAGEVREEDVFERLAALAGAPPSSSASGAAAPHGRVRRAPERLGEYRERRGRTSDAFAQALREDWRTWLSAAGVRAPPAVVADGHGTPFSLRWTDGQTRVVVALPNWTEPLERSEHTLPIELTVTAPAGQRVLWLHPSGSEGDPGRKLIPGDAAVFLVGP